MTIPSSTDEPRTEQPRRRVDAPSATRHHAAAAQLISETAHDLRAPLTAIRESVRLVRDGELGVVGREQRDCLTAAIEQCDCVDQMVGEMVQLDRQHLGTPATVRQWVSVGEVRRAVEETLRPWASQRQITVLWDGADDPRRSLFGDPQLLRRLIVNLVVNSMQATAEGESVLVRLSPLRGGEAVRLSVIDQGRGICEADLHRIAQHGHISDSRGGAPDESRGGRGLLICRQLAALHFSSLRIRSRLGTGTEVSFDVPTGGPSSVAACWSRWRAAQRRPGKRAPHHTASGSRDAGELGMPPVGRRARLDPPSVEIEMSAAATRPRWEDRLVAGMVTLGATMPRRSAEAFDRVLQRQQRPFDLVYRIDQRSWGWLLDNDVRSAGSRLDRIAETAAGQIDNLRLSWSQPQSIPVDERRTAAQVSDLLVRQALQRYSNTTAGDKNQVRLGTAPLACSPAASQRLDRELHQLSRRMSEQSEQLRRQSHALRPLS